MADFQPFDYGQVVDAANRNALAQAQLSTIRQQNEMAQQKFSLEQQQQNTDWLRTATDQVLQNPDLLPSMLEVGRQRGIINPSFDTNTITLDQVRQLNQRLKVGIPEQQDQVQSAQILANGNIGYLSKSGKLVDTGQKASETYAIRDVAGAVMPISTRTGRAGQPLATAAQTQEAEAAKGAAVTSAVETAKLVSKQAGEEKSNQTALAVYDAAMSGLVSALGGTTTGPGVGLLPAMTANQQIADGAVAAMAPTLKQMFRAAGEGTFTDTDQRLLLDMIPTRKDLPAARQAKIANIDAIVRAKLGAGVQIPQTMQGRNVQAPTVPVGAPSSVGRFQIEVVQ